MMGLLDIDNKIANLPLMKIKSYYKNNCEWYDGISNYEKVYVSKIFKFSNDWNYKINADEIIKGGTGYNFNKLPIEIENCQPDYSLYPECDYSLQRYTVGCIRDCDFCIVRDKEGVLKEIDPMNLNPNGKYIYLLDNNFFASKNWKSNIVHLQNCSQRVQFEGIDIRILTEEMITELNKIKPYKQFHFAWDNIKDNIEKKLDLITKIIKPYKLMCYVLIGFNSTKEDDYYRVVKLAEYGISPFVMPYNKKDEYQKKFARWVNHKAIFNSVDWNDYKTKRG
jgi:hypothetical protein